MKWKNILLLAATVLVFLGLLLIGFMFLINPFEFAESTPCDSYEGKEIQISLDKISIEKSIDIPNGKFVFSNLQDTLPPLMIKTDNANKVIWARAFPDSVCWIPHSHLLIGKLEKHDYGFIIRCFNDSYSEPATIYLDENYNFKNIYFSAM